MTGSVTSSRSTGGSLSKLIAFGVAHMVFLVTSLLLISSTFNVNGWGLWLTYLLGYVCCLLNQYQDRLSDDYWAKRRRNESK